MIHALCGRFEVVSYNICVAMCSKSCLKLRDGWVFGRSLSYKDGIKLVVTDKYPCDYIYMKTKNISYYNIE